MKILGIIPVKFELPVLQNNLLLKANGKSILEMVYLQCLKSNSLSEVVVATDSEVVFNHVKAFGGNVLTISEHHRNTTDRCAEALKVMGGPINFDFVINISGHEPLFHPENIDKLCASFRISSEICSVFTKIKDTDTLLNPNSIKTVMNENQEAIYFSRSPVPHLSGVDIDAWLAHENYYKHIRIYGYRADILEKIVKLPMAKAEKMENLQQLRWINNGYKIKMVEVESMGLEIRTQEDFDRLRQFLNRS